MRSNHSFQADAASRVALTQVIRALWKDNEIKTSVVVAVFLLPVSLSAGNSAREVPDQFLGDWGTSLTDCGTEADDTSLQIGKRHISYHESSGLLQAVVVRGTNEVALVAELASEGKAWLDASTFMLSPDGKQLAQRFGANGKPLVRVRCDSILGSHPGNPFMPNPLSRSAQLSVRPRVVS